MEEKQFKKECVYFLTNLNIISCTEAEIDEFKKNFSDILSEYKNLDRSKICIRNSISLDNKEVYAWDLVVWWYYNKKEKYTDVFVPQRNLAKLRDKIDDSTDLGGLNKFLEEKSKFIKKIEKYKMTAFLKGLDIERRNIPNDKKKMLEELCNIYYIINPVLSSKIDYEPIKYRYARDYIANTIANNMRNGNIYFFEKLQIMAKHFSNALSDINVKSYNFKTLGATQSEFKKILDEDTPITPATEHTTDKPALSAIPHERRDSLRKKLDEIMLSRGIKKVKKIRKNKKPPQLNKSKK